MAATAVIAVVTYLLMPSNPMGLDIIISSPYQLFVVHVYTLLVLLLW